MVLSRVQKIASKALFVAIVLLVSCRDPSSSSTNSLKEPGRSKESLLNLSPPTGSSTLPPCPYPRPSTQPSDVRGLLRQVDSAALLSSLPYICFNTHQDRSGLRITVMHSRGPTEIIQLEQTNSSWVIEYHKLPISTPTRHRSIQTSHTLSRQEERTVDRLIRQIDPWSKAHTYQSFPDGTSYYVEVFSGSRSNKYIYRIPGNDPHNSAIASLLALAAAGNSEEH